MIGGEKQFILFFLCVGVGFCNGLIYEFFHILRWVFRCNKGKVRWLAIVLDLLFCITFAIICQTVSVYFHFPDLRIYMLCGYGTGFIIYLKTLHRIVAFLKKVCYNTFVRLLKSLKSKKNSFKRLHKYD